MSDSAELEFFDLRSADPLEPRLASLVDAFPEAFVDGKLDLAVVARLLGDSVESGPERFGLNWPGKAECAKVISAPSRATLLPSPEKSLGTAGSHHVVIEGENLETLKLLQKSYFGAVNLIYIDPPYNTGKEFIYPDHFADGLTDYLRYSGQLDDEGMKLSANAETDGRFHSNWLSMLYPRLFLARNLLAEDGAIFVSIDDHEVHNLRALMNEVFGEENFIASIIWHKMDSPKNSAVHLSEDHEYVLLYARNAATWRPKLLPRTEEMLARYKNPDGDPRGAWLLGDLAARNFYASGRYPITTPSGRVIDGPPPGSYWRISEEKFNELDQDGRIWWGAGDTRPGVKRFLSEVRDGVVPQTYWSWEEVGSTRNSKRELSTLMNAASGDDLFVTPKPTKLIERILQTGAGQDALVLDFFAGSGTTGDAVLRANARDGGSRRYIMVQLPEPTGSDDENTLASMLRDRMNAAANRLKGELGGSEADLGFRAFMLAESNFRAWDPTKLGLEEVAEQLELATSNVLTNATEEAILAELLLKAGFGLTPEVEVTEFAGTRGYSIEDDSLLVCLSDALSVETFEAMVERAPAMILVLDNGFAGNDELKVNALQTVRARNQRDGSDIALRVV